MLAHGAGDHITARRFYHESLAIYRALRYPYGIAVTLNNLGELAELNGDLQTAIALFIHAQRLLHDLHSVDERIPAEHLQRLAEQTGAERFADLRRAAEQRTWEEMV